MRVVAGTARGRRLVAPAGDRVRPTSDRVREAVFNSLTSLGMVQGSRVVDLFAGSGALGIEALSRGADSVVFVDPDHAATEAITTNLRTIGLEGSPRVHIAATTAREHLDRAPDTTYALALVDPPYAFDDWAALFGLLDPWMDPDGVIVVESDRPVDPAAGGAPGWMILRQKRYGGTVLGINVRTEPPTRDTGAEP